MRNLIKKLLREEIEKTVTPRMLDQLVTSIIYDIEHTEELILKDRNKLSNLLKTFFFNLRKKFLNKPDDKMQQRLSNLHNLMTALKHPSPCSDIVHDYQNILKKYNDGKITLYPSMMSDNNRQELYIELERFKRQIAGNLYLLQVLVR